jgi:glycosyltransferase involved in cell wall biosynthesis
VILAYNALHLRPGLADGGATFTINVLARLPEALPEARVLVYLREGEDRIAAAEHVRLRPLRVAGTGRRVALETLWLGRDLRRQQADLLLSPNESIPVSPPCPVIVVAQNLVYHQCPRPAYTGARLADRALTRTQYAYYRRRMRAVYERAAAIVAVSETAKGILVQRAGLEASKATVVLEGADSLLLPEPAGEREREPRLLAVATLAPYKGIDHALELLVRLREHRPELALDVVGSDWRGYGSVLARRAGELGVAGSVRWLRDLPSHRLADLYARSLAMLHLSTCEAFGLPAVEAMRYGLPVVAANRSSLPEVTAGAALLVEPTASAAAAARVAELLASDEEREELSRRGRERAAELTWSRTAAGLAGVVRQAVGN